MDNIPFIKMHGAGNDFVVIDVRSVKHAIDDALRAHVVDRRFGVGCDQLIVMEPSQQADVFMRIYNADGSEVSACGNASRCVGWLLMQQSGSAAASIETRAGILQVVAAGERLITVDMGKPLWGWKDVPLAREMDSLHLPLQMEGLRDAVGVSMGNPHAVFFVDDVQASPLATVGVKLEHDALFPERANISAAQIIDARTIQLRVWERGVGETLACGTAACATLVAAHRRGLLSGREADVILPGGTLHIQWLSEEKGGHVLMTGPVAVSFHGQINRIDYA